MSGGHTLPDERRREPRLLEEDRQVVGDLGGVAPAVRLVTGLAVRVRERGGRRAQLGLEETLARCQVSAYPRPPVVHGLGFARPDQDPVRQRRCDVAGDVHLVVQRMGVRAELPPAGLAHGLQLPGGQVERGPSGLHDAPGGEERSRGEPVPPQDRVDHGPVGDRAVVEGQQQRPGR